MKIAVDAMGGDQAPGEVVRGAVKAIMNEVDADIMLVGRKPDIESSLGDRLGADARLHLHHAEQVITMDDSPVAALRSKRDSSITKSVALLRTGEVQAVVSAGNTGAVVASTMLMAKKLEGVKRPGIASPFPSDTEKGICIIIDAGANVKCKPIHLLQYGVMGSVYSKHVIGVENPRVALVNIGVEDVKGSPLVKEARSFMKDANLNFVGNVEGQEIFRGACDVAVCDGFVGNVIIKIAEGMGEGMLRRLKDKIESYVTGGGDKKVAEELLMSQNLIGNYSEYGGAPLLGIDGTCIICHGRSDSNAIYNAIKVAQKVVQTKVNEEISEKIKALGLMWRLTRFFDRDGD